MRRGRSPTWSNPRPGGGGGGAGAANQCAGPGGGRAGGTGPPGGGAGGAAAGARLSAAPGYVRAILDAGPAVGPLLHLLAQELTRTPDTSPAFLAYVYRLRDAGGPGDPLPPLAPGPDPAPTPAPRNPAAPLLTSRELAIVRLLETGYSNQEIADRLIIGVSTVKWYLREIYEKLGSTNRTQAVARARALRLLH